MASSLEGQVGSSDVKAEEGALLKEDLPQGEEEGDYVAPEGGPAEILGDADGSLAQWPSSRWLTHRN